MVYYLNILFFCCIVLFSRLRYPNDYLISLTRFLLAISTFTFMKFEILIFPVAQAKYLSDPLLLFFSYIQINIYILLKNSVDMPWRIQDLTNSLVFTATTLVQVTFIACLDCCSGLQIDISISCLNCSA